MTGEKESKHQVLNNKRCAELRRTMVTASLLSSLSLMPAVAQEASNRIQLPTISVEGAEESEVRTYAPNAVSSDAGVLTTIEETPFTINTMESEFIRDRNVKSFGDVADYLPGVTRRGSYNGGYDRIDIRGFRLDETGGFTRNGIKYYRRGELPTANIERIEALKGPAAITANNIAPGGLINIVTKKPLKTSLNVVEAELNHHGGWEIRNDINAPSLFGSDRARLRINTSFQEDSRSFIDDIEEDDYFIAPVLDFDLTDRTLLRLDTEFRHFRGNQYPGLLAIFDDEAAELETTPERFLRRQDVENFLGEENATYDFESQTVNLELFHEFESGMQFHAVASYAHFERDVDGIALGDFAQGGLVNNMSLADTTLAVRGGGLFSGDSIFFEDEQDTYGIETNLRGDLTTGSLKHHWLVGGDWEDRDNSYPFYLGGGSVSPIDVFNPRQTGDFDGLTGSTVLDFDDFVRDRQWGVFAQAQTDIGESGLRALYGIRYINYDNRLTNEEYHETLYRAGLAYIPPALPSTTFFAGYTESFEPVNASPNLPNPQPTEGRQFEAGIKQFFFDERLFAQFSVYRIEQENIVVQTEAPPFSQDAEASSEGFEIELVGMLGENLQISANYSYINLDKESGSLSELDLAEDAPEQTASVWMIYDMSQLLPGLRVGGGLRYVDERTILLAGPDIDEDSYTLLDLFAAYRITRDTEVRLNIDNVTDERYHVGQASYNHRGVVPGDPITATLTLSHSF